MESGQKMEQHLSEIIVRAAGGDSAAREELLEMHRDQLTRMVATRIDKRLAQRVDASDVVQEATIEAARRLPEYLADPSMDFYLWLRWIARDQLIDMHRQHLESQKRDAGREVSIDAIHADHSAAALAGVLAGDLTSPSGAMQKTQEQAAVREAIQQLDPADREILVLRHYEQLSTRQAAEVIGMSKSGAGKRHVTALRKLKEVLNSKLVDERA